MRILWIVPFLLASLACAAPAQAASPAPPGCFPLQASKCYQPGGGSYVSPASWCSWGVCYTRDPADEHIESFQVNQFGNLSLAGSWYRRLDTNAQGQTQHLGCGIIFYPPAHPYGYAPCMPVQGYFVSHTYSKYHKYRTDRPYSSGTITTFRALDGLETQKSASSISTLSDPSANTPDCRKYEIPDGVGGFIPAPTAPAEIMPACWPDHLPEGEVIDEEAGEDTDEEVKPDTVVPCRSVKVRRSTIMIRRTRSNCHIAQNIVRRYVARGREPSKWICVTASSGRNRVARCAYIGRTPIIVTGRWRVRARR